MLNSMVEKQLFQGLKSTTTIRLKFFNGRIKLSFNKLMKSYKHRFNIRFANKREQPSESIKIAHK